MTKINTAKKLVLSCLFFSMSILIISCGNTSFKSDPVVVSITDQNITASMTVPDGFEITTETTSAFLLSKIALSGTETLSVTILPTDVTGQDLDTAIAPVKTAFDLINGFVSTAVDNTDLGPGLAKCFYGTRSPAPDMFTHSEMCVRPFNNRPVKFEYSILYQPNDVDTYSDTRRKALQESINVTESDAN